MLKIITFLVASGLCLLLEASATATQQTVFRIRGTGIITDVRFGSFSIGDNFSFSGNFEFLNPISNSYSGTIQQEGGPPGAPIFGTPFQYNFAFTDLIYAGQPLTLSDGPSSLDDTNLRNISVTFIQGRISGFSVLAYGDPELFVIFSDSNFSFDDLVYGCEAYPFIPNCRRDLGINGNIEFSNVPEQSTWAGFIAGFILVGILCRRLHRIKPHSEAIS